MHYHPDPFLMKISLAHSPDSDDAFMFYGLARGKVAADGFEITHVLKDIETLNEEARAGVHEITAISFHAYPYVADRYALMPCGGSIGDGYGPLVVSREPMRPEDLHKARIAVPGLLTTAYLALRLFAPNVETVVLPFNEILPAVASGEVAAGLIIHEGQLTYAQSGLHRVLDLGTWWKNETGFPLPLGGNAVRRDLGDSCMQRLTQLVRETVRYSLAHRAEALEYALSFARGMPTPVADRFVGMWVNDMTVDCGTRGREAIQLLLDRGHQAGVIPHAVTAEFVAA